MYKKLNIALMYNIYVLEGILISKVNLYLIEFKLYIKIYSRMLIYDHFEESSNLDSGSGGGVVNEYIKKGEDSSLSLTKSEAPISVDSKLTPHPIDEDNSNRANLIVNYLPQRIDEDALEV